MWTLRISIPIGLAYMAWAWWVGDFDMVTVLSVICSAAALYLISST